MIIRLFTAGDGCRLQAGGAGPDGAALFRPNTCWFSRHFLAGIFISIARHTEHTRLWCSCTQHMPPVLIRHFQRPACKWLSRRISAAKYRLGGSNFVHGDSVDLAGDAAYLVFFNRSSLLLAYTFRCHRGFDPAYISRLYLSRVLASGGLFLMKNSAGTHRHRWSGNAHPNVFLVNTAVVIPPPTGTARPKRKCSLAGTGQSIDKLLVTSLTIHEGRIGSSRECLPRSCQEMTSRRLHFMVHFIQHLGCS